MLTSNPDIEYSVIIPTRNRALKLKRCLQHVSELNFDENLFEVIVIDNASTDDTKRVADSFKDKISCLGYFVSDMPGLHSGRNLGCEKAKGNVLCYIDDDSFVSKSWLKGIEKAFREPEVVLVGGPCLPEYEVEPPTWTNQFWGDTDHGKCFGSLSLLDFGDQINQISPYYVYGCNFNIRRDVLEELGGFHPDAMPQKLIKYRGDGESYVSRYVLEHGYKTLYHPKASVYHLVSEDRMTSKYFYHRAFIQGISDSFTQIREEHGLDGGILKVNNVSLPHKLARIIRGKLSHIKKSIFPDEPKNIRKIRATVRKSYDKGFAFHQNEVKKDPKLLQWVLRENYLGENGRLPE